MTASVSFPSGASGGPSGGGGHNPDILTCLANLSADEVFTPPKLANAMLDTLPPELFQSPDTTFLDPFTKSGVFLREIARRLNAGLADQMPDEQKRVNHILTKQVFGMGISELTWLIARRSLYCSKKADGRFSICTAFDRPEGNIIYPKTRHRWNNNGKCEDCGASQESYERGEESEAYAYPFIHGIDPQEEFNVKFDVIVGNPPYQLKDGGYGRAASPIYQRFVTQAKKLEPRYLSMVIPSRWFAGGKGLNDFREEMLNDEHLRRIVDFESSSELFPGVDVAGGICYFLWDRDTRGLCTVDNVVNGEVASTTRKLNEFSIFIRSSRAIPIVKKVIAKHGANALYVNSRVSPSKPFGMRTFYKPTKTGVPCWFIQRLGRQYADPSDVKDENKLLNKWKLLIPKAPIAGQTDFSKPVRFYYDENTRIAKPGECCTESWLVACAFDTKREVESFKSYLFTKVVRFLLLQTVISQDVTRKNFAFIPDLGEYKEKFTDAMLLERWGLTNEEWAYIDSKIG